jgi:hypothetical protein
MSVRGAFQTKNRQAEHVRCARINSEIDLSGNRRGIIDLNTKIADGAFCLGVAEQDLPLAR